MIILPKIKFLKFTETWFETVYNSFGGDGYIRKALHKNPNDNFNKVTGLANSPLSCSTYDS